MKINPDGSIEGTPEEIARYNAARGGTDDIIGTVADFCACNPKNGGNGVCGCTVANEPVRRHGQIITWSSSGTIR